MQPNIINKIHFVVVGNAILNAIYNILFLEILSFVYLKLRVVEVYNI